MGNMVKAVQDKDWPVALSAISALTFFASEKAYRVLLSNANQMFNFYETLLSCIQGQVSANGLEVPPPTRFAAATIISKMLADKDLVGIQDAIMKEGVMTHIAKGLRDQQLAVRKECAIIIKSMTKFLTTNTESFKPLIQPLIANLGEDDDTLLARTLDCLRTLSSNEVLRELIV
jgi:hypothetical protein